MLVPDTRHIVVTGSGHNIQIDHPRAVADAIHDVFGTARQQQGHISLLQARCHPNGSP